MYKHAHDSDSAEFAVFNMDTGQKIDNVVWADDKSGNYGQVVSQEEAEAVGRYFAPGVLPILERNGNIKLYHKIGEMEDMVCPRSAGYDPAIFNGIDENEFEADPTVCSFCGSMHPDIAMQKIEAGELVVPTDKSYKIYIGEEHKKFYFQHLSEDQMKRIVQLLNEKKINFAEPGHFYVKPFFIQ